MTVPVPDGGTRRGCGTYLAYLLHRALDELPCMACYRARFPGGLLREGIPARPPLALGPVSEFQAARNRRVLEEALDELDGEMRRAA